MVAHPSDCTSNFATRGNGFKLLLGAVIINPTIFQWCVPYMVPRGGKPLLIYPKRMHSCASWDEASFEWDLKICSLISSALCARKVLGWGTTAEGEILGWGKSGKRKQKLETRTDRQKGRLKLKSSN